MQTYGTIKLKRGIWSITAEPHVMIRLKRVFPRVKQWMQTLSITDTLEVCRDLDWFLTRFPLAMTRKTRRHIRAGALAHAAHAEKVHEIVLAETSDLGFDLAEPARDYQKVAAALCHHVKALLLADDMGLGKQHAVDTKVLTPTGYVRIDSLRIGDEVVGSDGRATVVTGFFPQGVQPSYRLTFTDGSSVEAGPEHLWKMRYIAGGRRSRGSMQAIIVTTEQMRTEATIKQQWPGRADTQLKLSRRLQLFLPLLSRPVEFQSPGSLPIPPYTLGQLIANAALGKGTPALATNNHDWEEVRAQLEEDGTSVGAVKVYGGSTRATISGIVPLIRSLGLAVHSREKRIPEIYLRAPVAARVRLLHGLMDADGSISKTRSRVTYHTTSEGLAADVRTLVQCLGGVASVRTYDRSSEKKPVEYQVRVRLPREIPPCSVRRKLDRYSPVTRDTPTRSLRAIDYVRDVESVCISVVAADRLYCVENAILTHNTISAIALLSLPGTLPALVATPAGIVPRQWQRQLARFAPTLRTHVLRGSSPYELTTLERVNGSMRSAAPDVVISSYHRLGGWRDHLAGKFRTCVADELQKLKNDDTTMARAWDHIASGATYRMGLTGTPIHNLGSEMHPVMERLAPGRLGSREEYLQEWCSSPDRRGRASLTDPAAFGTYLRSEGLLLRRSRQDVGRELPALTKVIETIDWDADQLESIKRPASELAQIILSSDKVARELRRDAGRDFSMMLRLATGLAKAIAVADLVKMAVESGEPVVLFGWHRAVYDIWAERLKEYDPAWITGEESDTQKEKHAERFMNGSTPVLIMSLRAGLGIDGLQNVCRTVIFGELDWSPAVHEQCTTRVFRDGQAHPVFAYYPLCEDTDSSDPVLVDMLGVKRAQLEGIRDPTGAFLENLDTGGDHVKRLAAAYLKKREAAA